MDRTECGSIAYGMAIVMAAGYVVLDNILNSGYTNLVLAVGACFLLVNVAAWFGIRRSRRMSGAIGVLALALAILKVVQTFGLLRGLSVIGSVILTILLVGILLLEARWNSRKRH